MQVFHRHFNNHILQQFHLILVAAVFELAVAGERLHAFLNTVEHLLIAAGIFKAVSNYIFSRLPDNFAVFVAEARFGIKQAEVFFVFTEIEQYKSVPGRMTDAENKHVALQFAEHIHIVGLAYLRP
ncbi:hypothetical protein SDC9_46269 [bioreactor metagenome]|uniref:Uncharacterized protein n=1 Tax=bioreactor metagenome TaxID=1076179 RepID=A0A644W8C2_9ZZZZ